ncbi:MAG: hypothetical protein ACTS41_01180 [Candidatus Hodgkinia cicadicola]
MVKIEWITCFHMSDGRLNFVLSSNMRFVLGYLRICSMIYHFTNGRITNFRLRVTIVGAEVNLQLHKSV